MMHNEMRGMSAKRVMSRRRMLAGLAGGAVTAILAACGSDASATNTSAPAAPTTGSAGATNAATVKPAASPAASAASGSVAATGATAPAAATAAPAGMATTAASAAPMTASTTGGAVAASPTPLKTMGTVTLEVWGGVPPETGPGDLVAAFSKAYPNIKVNYTRFVNDDTGNTKLDTALQGGTPIDLYFSYDVPRMGQRIKAGVAEDLTPYIAADSAIKQWTDGTKGIFQSQNKYFSLPTTREPNYIFINKKLADAAGAKAPDKWTLDEFRAMAKMLASGSGDKRVYGTYLLGPTSPDIAQETLGPNRWYKPDGSASNFDHPAFKMGLEFNRGMLDEKSAFPWQEVLAQNLRAYSQNPFLDGQVVMWPSSSFSLRYVNDKMMYPHDFVTTFAPLPTPVGASPAYNLGSINNWLMMQPKTKNKDAAWAFTRYWLTDGAQYMLKAGKVPAFPGTDPEVVINGILGPDKDKLYDAAAYKKVVFDPGINLVTDTITTAGAEILKLVTDTTDRYYIGEISYDQWLMTVKTQADDAIKKAKA